MRKLLTSLIALGAAIAAILSPCSAQNVPPNSFTTENIVTYLGTQTFSDVIGKVTNQTGTTYTLALSDCGTEVSFTNPSAVTVTIPAIGFGVDHRLCKHVRRNIDCHDALEYMRKRQRQTADAAAKINGPPPGAINAILL